jgi:hypothetical protein
MSDTIEYSDFFVYLYSPLLAVVIVITLDALLSLSLFHSIVFSYRCRSSLFSLCSSSIYVRAKDILNSNSSFE